MHTSDELKKQVAKAALDYIVPDTVIGVGTGSTVNAFIEVLSQSSIRIASAVATSLDTENRLIASGFKVVDLNGVGPLDQYFDGADEFDSQFCLLKGGGGAMTREKIVASATRTFICMVDETKKVNKLGEHAPIPVEVMPMARSYVARELVKLGGNPVYREHFETDNGNVIIDVYGLDRLVPSICEEQLNNIVGVVGHGLFTVRPADIILVASQDGLETRHRASN